MYAIGLGDEDLDDHEALRSDPVLQALFAAAYANLKAIPCFRRSGSILPFPTVSLNDSSEPRSVCCSLPEAPSGPFGVRVSLFILTCMVSSLQETTRRDYSRDMQRVSPLF